MISSTKYTFPNRSAPLRLGTSAPFQTADGGGAQAGFLEQEDEFEVAQRPLLRQRSAPTGDIEMARLRLLPRRALLPARLLARTVEVDAADANNRPQAAPACPPWPGENFKVASILPGSVYLWACGERDEGDGTSPVSTAEACAAWVVLMVSAVSRLAHQQGFGRKCVGVRKKWFRGLLAEEACLDTSLAHLGIAKGCPA